MAVSPISRMQSSHREVAESSVAWSDADFVWCSPEMRIAAFGVAAEISGTGLEFATEVQSALGAIQTDGHAPIALGALPFDPHAVRSAVIPEVAYIRRPGAETLELRIENGSGSDNSKTANAGPVIESQDETRWKEMVLRAIEHMEDGNARKIVLARQYEYIADGYIDRRALIDSLRDNAPRSYVFAHRNFVGATPELLVRRRHDRMWSEPMAGTTPLEHGLKIIDQEAVVSSTLSDKKREEHMPTPLDVAEVMGRFADDVTVHDLEVRLFSTLAHLVTRIEARNEVGLPDALTIALALHPTPAVGTSPRGSLDLLHEIERFDRGRYAGPVGWVDANGDGEWAIALRCGELFDDKAILTAGAGITMRSEPHDEWIETNSKLAVMIDALRSVTQTSVD